MQITTRTSVATCLIALAAGVVVTALAPGRALMALLFFSFAVCIGFSWYVIAESKALAPGIRGLLGEFDPVATTKKSPARLGFFASAAYTLGTLAGFFVHVIRMAN